MKLLFKTNTPNKLKKSILTLIDEGDLKTWGIHEYKNEKYIKHTQQWGEKGVVEMKINNEENLLEVRILAFESTEENVEDFEGYYLGRFCEIIFVNFPNSFTSINKN